MKILVEKGIHALVFAMLFATLAYVLYVLAPVEPKELYEIYSAQMQLLLSIASLFGFMVVFFLLIGIAPKFGVLVRANRVLRDNQQTIGVLISLLGVVCIMLFIGNFVVFPWQA